jgi:hypothetical protein
MKASLFAASVGLGLLTAAPMQAQRVSAEIVIGSGPVAGHVIIGGPRYYYRPTYFHRYPVRRVFIERRIPRVIVVERFHRGRGYYRHHGYRDHYRPVRAYYDNDRSLYYDDNRSGLREVTLYEQDGRYYHNDDDYDD